MYIKTFSVKAPKAFSCGSLFLVWKSGTAVERSVGEDVQFNIGFLWAGSLSLKKRRGWRGQAARPHLHTLQPLHMPCRPEGSMYD